MSTLRDTILQAQDIQSESITIPEWGVTLTVRGMTGAERDSFEASCVTDGKATVQNVRAKIAVRCTVDDNGNRVFSDSDAPALGAKSARALDRLYEVAARLSGIGKHDVEELAKNSDAALIDASPSA